MEKFYADNSVQPGFEVNGAWKYAFLQYTFTSLRGEIPLP